MHLSLELCQCRNQLVPLLRISLFTLEISNYHKTYVLGGMMGGLHISCETYTESFSLDITERSESGPVTEGIV